MDLIHASGMGLTGKITEEYADTNEILIRTDTEDGGKFTVSKYHGPVKGIIIYPPHYKSLMFKFDSDLYCQWSCKIQSVPSNIHIRVIELFDMIHPLFEFIDILNINRDIISI